MSEQTRREFLELTGRGVLGFALLQIAPGCETFNIDAETVEAPYNFLTPPDEWFWFSAFGGEPRQSPQISADEWLLSLTSGGTAVGEISFRKLKALEADGKDVSYLKTMRCIFGSYANTTEESLTATGIFRGIPLRDVLADTTISGETTKLRFEGADGFRTSISYDRMLSEDLLPVILAYELNGQPISPERGGPVRLIVPEMWAFKSLKWITTVDATTDFSTFGTLETGDLAGRTELDNPGLMALMTLVNNPPALTAEVAGPTVDLYGMSLVGGSRIAGVEVSVDGGEFTQASIPDIDTVLSTLGQNALLVRATEQFNQDWPYPNVWAPWTHTLTGLTPGPHQVILRSVDIDGNVNPSISADVQVLAQEVVLDLQVT